MHPQMTQIAQMKREETEMQELRSKRKALLSNQRSSVIRELNSSVKSVSSVDRSSVLFVYDMDRG
jgi:hypothetical protein